jgi:tripartite-type tricarboxylate transporter receptor subunit TctC
MIRKVLLVIAALSGSSWFGTNVGWAEKWPDQPVRIIVPFAAGGTSDVLGRLIANYLTKVFGHPFIIENRAS